MKIQPSLFGNTGSGAVFSPCGRYRYRLWREWDEGDGTLAFICLNCSVATETIDDPTVYRCTVRAKRLGFRRYDMLNLFAWRSTDPRGLLDTDDPVGPENDAAILSVAREARMVICAWGSASPLIPARAKAVLALLEGVPLHALRISEKTGQPWHPLYLPLDLAPKLWTPQHFVG